MKNIIISTLIGITVTIINAQPSFTNNEISSNTPV
jgi:hypothetical protein